MRENDITIAIHREYMINSIKYNIDLQKEGNSCSKGTCQVYLFGMLIALANMRVEYPNHMIITDVHGFFVHLILLRFIKDAFIKAANEDGENYFF